MAKGRAGAVAPQPLEKRGPAPRRFEGVALSSIVSPVLARELKEYYKERGFFPHDELDVEHLDRFFERTEEGRPFISGSAVMGMLNMYTNLFGGRGEWDRIKPKVFFLRLEGERCVVHKRFVGKSIVVYECFPASTKLYLHFIDMGLTEEEEQKLRELISRAGSTVGIGAWLRRGFGRFRLL